MARRRTSPERLGCPKAALSIALLLFGVQHAAALRLMPSLPSLMSPWTAILGAVEDDNNICRPSQVHLAVTCDPTQMRVMWKTHGKSCPTKVHYGEGVYDEATDNSLFLQLPNVMGSTKTYSPHDMCASPARDYKYTPLILHDVVLTDLKPRRWYSYKVAHDHRILRFQAPPPPGRKEGFQFLVYGDMGDPHHRRAKTPGAAGTVKYVARDVAAGADLVLHVGDVAYADGREYVWDSFMDAIEPTASRVPYMVAVGNHEYDYQGKGRGHRDISGSTESYNPDWGNYGNDSGGECGVTLAMRFSMPGSGFQAAGPGNGSSAVADDANNGGAAKASVLGKRREPSNPPFWYSYDYGAVHFVMVSSEHDLHKRSQQYKWLQRDLERVDRCVTPWVVLGMHRPMYVVYPHKSNRRVGEHLRRQLEGLLSKHSVDLVFSGHVHSYSRTCNVLDGECVDMKAGGTTHITLGCGGHRLSDVNHDQPDWLVATHAQFGYGRVTVSDGYQLAFEYVRTKDGETHDRYVLQNSRADRAECFAREAADAASSQQ